MSLTLPPRFSETKCSYPLPANPFSHPSNLHTAFEHCLELERIPAWSAFVCNLPSDPPMEQILLSISPVLAARVLGYGLLYAPNGTGQAALTRDILECHEEREKLGVLAHLYVHGLIRVFINPKRPTPVISPAYTPRLSLGAAAQNPHLLQSSTSNASNLRTLTLIRDKCFCVFTGCIEWEFQQTAPTADIEHTNVAHIISQSLTENTAGVTPAHLAKFTWARTAGAMIERFGGFDAHDVLGQANLHSPKNAFTASLKAHNSFDALDIWLTPAKDTQDRVIADTYDVSGVNPAAIRKMHIKPQVAFNSHKDDQGNIVIPAPDPRIIELHAACAKIAHMSGAGEHLRELFRDTDHVAVMTQPNAAYELSRALRALQLVSATA